jgi:membrane protein YdbS with pleckstrin-like domain
VELWNTGGACIIPKFHYSNPHLPRRKSNCLVFNNQKFKHVFKSKQVADQNKPIFQNAPLDISQLPTLNDIDFLRLSPSYWRYAIVSTVITFAILALPLIGVWFNVEGWIAVLVTAFWGGVFIAVLILARYQYQIKGYLLRSHDIVYRQGLFFRRVTTIPFSRLQHCEIHEGPLERLFGLNTLLVYTAGGSSSDLAIPGLPPDEAGRLRDFILQKMNSDEEE